VGAGWLTSGLSVLLAQAEAPDAGSAAWPWLAALGTVGLLLLGLLLVFTKYLRISLKLFLDTKMPVAAGPENVAPIAAEVQMFPSSYGARLTGVFLDPPPGQAARGTIVFAHEYSSDRRSAVRYAAGLTAMGLRVFSFDFRGHGESSNDSTYHPCHWVTDREVHDLLAAVAFVQTASGGDDHLPIGIMGVSRGACAAVMAAIHAPEIRVLVLDGVFSTDVVVEELMRRWAVIFATTHLIKPNHPPVVWAFLRAMTMFYAELTMRVRYPLVRKFLTRLKDVPVLFIFGDADAYVTKPHRLELYRAKPGLKQMWEAPSAKHNQAVAVEPERYRQEITTFLDKYMPAAGPGGSTPNG
jgi:hypothetical protein